MKNKSSMIKLIAIFILVAMVACMFIFLPVKDTLVAMLDWTRGLGAVGPLVVIGAYILACVFFIPGSILTIGAGFLFGIGIGTATVSIGATLGAAAAFLVGRTLARNWIASKVANNTKFSAIDEAVGKEGFKLVFLLRLSPIFPFNLLNYALGLTKVSFGKYFLASWLGMLPGTLMYVYLGSAARSLTDIAAGKLETGIGQQIFFWLGLAVTVITAVFVTRMAGKSLKAGQAK